MSGSADLFVIGAAGARAYRAAMGAISENIANATTEGYNRRSIEIIESPVSSATSPYYTASITFGGSQVNGVRRANDPYLDAAARLTGSTLGNADARLRWLSDVERAINDGDLGVGRRIGNFFSSAERLAANPVDATLRTNVIFSLEQVATAFAESHKGLAAISTGIAGQATNEVTALNDALYQLARANEGLRRAPPNTGAEVTLLDSRDQALAAISKRIDATFTFESRGTVRVDYAGQPVLTGLDPQDFAVSASATGILSFTLNGTAVATPTNGALAGLATSASITADRTVSLNTLAAQFVANVNTWHTAGTKPDGTAGAALMSIGTDASTIQVLASTANDIAAASGGVPNGNLLNLATLRGSTGVEQGWSMLVAAHGNLLNGTVTEQKASSLRDGQARTSRDDVSGVDLDREAADLLRLQQAYNASARVIQVAREIADTILRVT